MEIKDKNIKLLYLIFIFLIILILNISFIYNIHNNYKNKEWNSKNKGLIIYVCIFDVFIDLYLISLSFIIYILEAIHILNLKIFDFFIIFGIEIRTQRTRLIFGLIQLIISSYYIQYNIDNVNNMMILKIVFSTLYFVMGLLISFLVF